MSTTVRLFQLIGYLVIVPPSAAYRGQAMDISSSSLAQRIVFSTAASGVLIHGKTKL